MLSTDASLKAALWWHSPCSPESGALMKCLNFYKNSFPKERYLKLLETLRVKQTNKQKTPNKTGKVAALCFLLLGFAGEPEANSFSQVRELGCLSVTWFSPLLASQKTRQTEGHRKPFWGRSTTCIMHLSDLQEDLVHSRGLRLCLISGLMGGALHAHVCMYTHTSTCAHMHACSHLHPRTTGLFCQSRQENVIFVADEDKEENSGWCSSTLMHHRRFVLFNTESKAN